MSDAVNPYKTPETAAVPERPAEGNLTETMLIYLKAASPWLRFIGILGFVGAGGTALTGLVFIVMISLMGQEWRWSEIPGYEGISGAMGTIFSGAMAVLFIACGVILFFPSLFTYRFGEKIRNYFRTGTEQELELAFKNNKSLWKFYGIVCIVYLAFIPLMVIVGVIVGVMAVFI